MRTISHDGITLSSMMNDPKTESKRIGLNMKLHENKNEQVTMNTKQ